MSYFLVLGILYKKYQKPADITLYIGNTFIDTFNLDRDFLYAKDIIPQIETHWYKKYGKEHWITSPRYAENWKNIPALFKVYEIDDNAVEGKLKIKVENSDSDFTNGFMKNSSLIKFPITALIPKKLTENKAEKLMENWIKLDADVTIQEKEKGPNFPSVRWSCAESFYVKRENEIYEKSEMKSRHWWIGGSFTAELKIETINGIKYVAPMDEDEWLQNPLGISESELVLASCKKLLNIYDENS
jgi:hypothetical protein